MSFTVRHAVDSILDALVRFHDRFMEHHVAADEHLTVRDGARDQWPGRIAKAVADHRTLVLVADAGDRVVGCDFVLVRDGATVVAPTEVDSLCDVFVEAGSRRRGVAREFLPAAERWLEARGIHRIEARRAFSSPEARSTCLSLDFVPISTSGPKDF